LISEIKKIVYVLSQYFKACNNFIFVTDRLLSIFSKLNIHNITKPKKAQSVYEKQFDFNIRYSNI